MDLQAHMMTADEARQSFLRYLGTERRAAPATVEAYGRDVGFLLEFLGRHLGKEPGLGDLAAISQMDLRSFMAFEAQQGRANPTRSRHLSAIRGFYRYLARRMGVRNSAADLMATPRTSKPLPRPLSRPEALAVTTEIGAEARSEAMEARDVALFTLLYGAGLRISEALNLNVVNAGDDPLVITGKGNKQRLVPVLPAIKAAI